MYNLVRIIDDILNFILPNNKLLLAGEWAVVHVKNDSTDDNIYYFSGDQPENSNSNSNNNPNSEDGDVEMADSQPGNSESNSNSNNPDSEDDDVEDADVEEVPNHNAPEEVMNDLDKVDAARDNNDAEALAYLKREYSSFFDDNTEEEALDQIEEYLTEEFPKELKRSEEEADAMSIEEKKAKGQNSDDSDNNDNNSSGGGGPLGPSGPSASDSGPSSSNSSGGNLSKILVILGGVFETISNVLDNIIL